MNLEGCIDISLGGAGGVRLRSTRPQLAQKLLGGRSPEEAAHLVGLIFSLCGKAQRVAAAAACEAALPPYEPGVPCAATVPSPQLSQARASAVLQELALEHLWRFAAPQETPEGRAGLLALRQAAPEPQRFATVLAEQVQTLLGEPGAVWLGRDLADFDAWVATAATPTARLFAVEDAVLPVRGVLPSLVRLSDAEAADLARQALEVPDFCARPTLHGAPAETGALARVDHPLLAAWIARSGIGAGSRLLARLLELAELPGRCGAGIPAGQTLIRAWSLGEGVGLAGVETARGLLLHVVRLHAGRVDQYRIVAPTEWNFHPDGGLPQALAALSPGPDLMARARHLCESLDPCVAYAIEVRDA